MDATPTNTCALYLAAGTTSLSAVTDGLEAQCLTFSTVNSNALVLITADLIWFSDAMVERLRPLVAKVANVSDSAIVFAASHTHGSPQPDPRFTVGHYNQSTIEEFERNIVLAVENTLRTPRSRVTLEFGRAPAMPSIAINRRKKTLVRSGFKIGRRVQSFPNYGRKIDSRVSVLIARHQSSRAIKAIIVHAICHPVTLPQQTTGPDFPGSLRKHLRKHYGQDTTISFLQGHCGDVRPKLIDNNKNAKSLILNALLGKRFRPSKEGDTEWAGRTLATAAKAAIANAQALSTKEMASARAAIPLEDENNKPTRRHLDVTAWRLSPTFALVASSGEMLSGLTCPDPRVLSIGYANGMVGYVAPASEYPGGGYEIDGFLPYFGLEKRFSNETEKKYSRVRADLLTRIGIDPSSERS